MNPTAVVLARTAATAAMMIDGDGFAGWDVDGRWFLTPSKISAKMEFHPNKTRRKNTPYAISLSRPGDVYEVF